MSRRVSIESGRTDCGLTSRCTTEAVSIWPEWTLKLDSEAPSRDGGARGSAKVGDGGGSMPPPATLALMRAALRAEMPANRL
jgi:hypothetical protein